MGHPRRRRTRYYYQKTVPLYFTPWGGRADPSITLDNLVGPDGLNNPAGVATEELAQLLDKSRSESDPEARAELLRETSREIMDDSRMIPIASPAIAIAFRPYVVGYEPPLTAHRFDFLGVGVTDDLG
ncbi:hypothetical protein E0W80_15280 [Microbacterium sp. PI-1]|uniref:hypothetical protein n=1 Tax=Microbacterium sp. PI-1 TaxID=2545631 RepID=UPI00103BCD51|nr:hypothetical protein [Microbacterium sp. PI-1]TCJ21979.1 hypothetical protein E0W80_15280 [Microbacterium sp. PI-1]